MITNRKLLPKLLRDWGIVVAMLALLVFNYYFLRNIDPAATVDGLAGVYNAMQVMIIAFATASLSATIRWLLFYPLKRSQEEIMMTEQRTTSALLVIAGDRLTWFAIWLVMFSAAIGH